MFILELNQIYLGDCLEIMKEIDDKLIDMILCDLPYGTTACKWDTIIPFESLWVQYKRIIKDNGAIVLTGQEPFSSNLRLSNVEMYKYDWIWEKSNPSNIAASKTRPLKYHEVVSVFYKKQPIYNPQMIKRDALGTKRLQNKNNPIRFSGSDIQGTPKKKQDYDIDRYDENYKNPSTVLKIKSQRGKLHPTQKPVELFEYLIKTYTNEDEIVLDNCIGSGTTAIAAINTGRNYVGIEKDKNYYELAKKRIVEHSNYNVSGTT